MTKTLLILKLIRWPNLLMMALILLLVRYCILLPIYTDGEVVLQMPLPDFLLLLIATVSIGAGGYIVNDILDVGLDEKNKPGQNPIGKQLSNSFAWKLYYTLNIIGIGIGTLISFRTGKPELGILFLVTATALYYYSLKYKYLFLWGNLTIAILSALTVAITWLFEFFYLKQHPTSFITISPEFTHINQLVLGYAFLAFFYSILREIIKDMQDIEGDRRFGCRTLPIQLGETKTRVVIIVLSFISIIILSILVYYIFERYMLVAISFMAVSILSAYIVLHLFRSRKNQHYGLLSKIAKAMMVIGILSMSLLWFPN
jgi:4-hydroxybenzoate polyprenyltransferase